MATYHAKNGRFTAQHSAHTVTRDGERFKMVRQLRRIGGKTTEPEQEPANDVVDTVEEAKAKEVVTSFLCASPGWIPLHGIVDVAFGGMDEATIGGYTIPSPGDLSKNKNPTGWDKLDREEMIQMYKDNIETQKSLGRPIPRAWLKGLAELERGKSVGGVEFVYSDRVFGHPQATNIKGYEHLIPIKVKAGDTRSVKRFIDRAQDVLNGLQRELSVIEATAKGRTSATPAERKAAKRKMKSFSFDEKKTIVDMIRKETVRELQSLLRAVG